MGNLLKMDHITMQFGGVVAVNDLNLERQSCLGSDFSSYSQMGRRCAHRRKWCRKDNGI